MFFRKRHILSAALVAGIGLGVYLGQFKGFGLGGGSHIGIGTSDGAVEGDAQVVAESSAPIATPLEPAKDEEAISASDVVRVVIDERKFLVRSRKKEGGGVPMELPKLIELIKQAPGDADGIRVRISMTTNARASAEEGLRKELEAAGIDDSSILWLPAPVQ